MAQDPYLSSTGKDASKKKLRLWSRREKIEQLGKATDAEAGPDSDSLGLRENDTAIPVPPPRTDTLLQGPRR